MRQAASLPFTLMALLLLSSKKEARDPTAQPCTLLASAQPISLYSSGLLYLKAPPLNVRPPPPSTCSSIVKLSSADESLLLLSPRYRTHLPSSSKFKFSFSLRGQETFQDRTQHADLQKPFCRKSCFKPRKPLPTHSLGIAK